MKRVSARWNYVIKDGTGCMITYKYCCPECDIDIGDLLSTSMTEEELECGFETDVVCDLCQKKHIVEFDPDNFDEDFLV